MVVVLRYVRMSLFLTVFLWLNSVSTVWGTSSKSVINTIGNTLNVERDIQKTQSGWESESDALFDEMELLEKESSRLMLKKKRLARIKKVEEKKYEEYVRRQKEVHRLKNEIASFLDMVLEKLEANIGNSLPFLTQERTVRLDSLKNLMADQDESWAEKFRQVFAALQIEAEYGSTVDVSQETIDSGQEKILVDVFRLGRIALIFQTVDQKRCGYFNMAEKVWKDLPAKYNVDIKKAISMARRERTVDLVNLPVGRIIAQ